MNLLNLVFSPLLPLCAYMFAYSPAWNIFWKLIPFEAHYLCNTTLISRKEYFVVVYFSFQTLIKYDPNIASFLDS